MSSQTTEEILKFVVQATGNESLTPIVRSILDLSGNSAEAEKAVGDLLTQLADSQKLTTTLEQYRKVGTTVLDLSKRYDEAKLKVAELGKSLSATDEPTKKQQQEFERARTALAKLGTQYDSQLEKLRGYRSELSSAGVSTSNFSAAQAQLKTRAAEVSTALTGMATAAKNTKDEQVALAARLADGDEAFRRQAEASKSAREALDRVKASTTATADAQAAAATKSTILGAAWTKLAAIGATLVGYLSLSAAVSGVKNLLGLADASEKTRLRLAALYGGVDAGNATFAKLRDIARANGLEFAGTAEAATRLKSFGIDPLNGSLQALIDQNARLGGSQETLNGIILAVGQAWAKQKLQGEEILQLVERGVPVWDLLSKATGKNVTELQKLSEAGKLGRTEIAALVREIGASAEGAAAQNLGTFGGLIVQLNDRWQQFLQTVADSGVLDYAKKQISGLIDEAKRLAADGSLARYAREFSGAMIAVGNGIAGATRFIYDHAAGIGTVIKTYLEFKAAQLALDLLGVANKWKTIAAETIAAGAAASGATGKFGGLINTLRNAPAAFQVAVTVVGFEILQRTAVLLGEIAAKNSEVARTVAANAEARRAQVQSEVDALHLAQQATIQYADVQVKSALEIASLSAAELATYEQRLAGAREYAAQQYSIALRQQELYGATVETNKQVTEAASRIKDLRSGFDDVAKGADIAAAALKSGIGAAASEIAIQIGDISSSATLAQTKLTALFADIETINPTRLGDIALALTSIGSQGERSAENLRRGLSVTLSKLSGEDLLKLQSAAQAAFEEFGVSAERAADVTNAVLLAALEKLGIQGDLLGVKFTEAGRDIVASFQVVAESANSTSAQIEAAFRAALASIGTSGEAEALGAALEAAGTRGRVSLDALSRSAAALKDRLLAIQAATDPLTDAFKQLGITSQRELDRAAAAAKSAFEQITAGARAGQAATDDVARAFQAYAQRARDAAENSDASTKRQIASQIELAGRIAGVTDELISAATAGLDAGDKIDKAGQRAAQSWSNVTDEVSATRASLEEAAGAAESSADRVASAAERAAQAQRNATGAAREAVDNLVAGGRQLDEYNAAMERLIRNNDEFVSRALGLEMAQRNINAERARGITIAREEIAVAREAQAVGVAGGFGSSTAATSTESGGTQTTASGGKSSVVEIVVRNEQNASVGATRISNDQIDQITRRVLDAIGQHMRAGGR